MFSTTWQTVRLSLLGIVALGVIGCEGTVSLIPDADPDLRQPPPVFAADAAKRHYEAGAQKVPDTDFRAQYGLIMREVDLANISNHDWDDVEVWINHTYVLHLKHFGKKSDKTLYFSMFYDQSGHHFDTDFGKTPIQSLEIFRDGNMYAVVDHVADI